MTSALDVSDSTRVDRRVDIRVCPDHLRVRDGSLALEGPLASLLKLVIARRKGGTSRGHGDNSQDLAV